MKNYRHLRRLNIMKEPKLTEEEKLTNQLRNFTIEEIESYLA